MKNWSFGMDNDNLVNLVLAGKKIATTCLYNEENIPTIGEESIIHFDNEKDAFSELISTLFSAALTMAAKIKASEMLAVVNKDAKLSESEEVKDDSSLIKRNREKVDASRLQMLASTIFETEIPENKQAVGLKTSLT